MSTTESSTEDAGILPPSSEELSVVLVIRFMETVRIEKIGSEILFYILEEV